MRFPSIFVNHGGGPLPLLGRQPALAQHMREVRAKWLPETKPDAIVVVSAHWESDAIEILSSDKPSILYDYGGFPAESYQYHYPAPGSPSLARKIQDLLSDNDIESKLNDKRGFDHGVFVPLMLMYPEADVPVVAVSLHNSLAPDIHLKLGAALAPLRDDNILILGSGYTFHNMPAFFHPSQETYQASAQFNDWLKNTLTSSSSSSSSLSTDPNSTCSSPGKVFDKLSLWEQAPGARIAHPREEHLLPLLVTAATSKEPAKLIYDTTAGDGEHAISSYLFA